MTVRLFVELSCDHKDCNLAYAPEPDEMTSVAETRKGSHRAGWTRLERMDYCPDHDPTGTAALVAVIAGLAAKHQTDSEIGAGLGMSREQIQRLRHIHDIPAGVQPGRPSRKTGGTW